MDIRPIDIASATEVGMFGKSLRTDIANVRQKVAGENEDARRRQMEEARQTEALRAEEAPKKARQILDDVPRIVETALRQGRHIPGHPASGIARIMKLGSDDYDLAFSGGGPGNFVGEVLDPKWLRYAAKIVFEICTSEGLEPVVRRSQVADKDGGTEPPFFIEIRY